MCNDCSPVLFSSVFTPSVFCGGGGEGEWGRRGRSEGEIGKQERGRDKELEGKKKRKKGEGDRGGGGRSEGGVRKQEGARDGEQEGRKKRKERDWREE